MIPVALLVFALFYVSVVNTFGQPPLVRVGMALGATYLGIKAPEIFLANQIGKRQLSIRRA